MMARRQRVRRGNDNGNGNGNGGVGGAERRRVGNGMGNVFLIYVGPK